MLITSIGPEEEYRWKDAVHVGRGNSLWIDDGTAHGLSAWFTKFNGVVPDTRWVEPVADTFGAACEGGDGARRKHEPTAEIAVIDPVDNAAPLGAGGPRAPPRSMISASTTRWSRRGCPSNSSLTRC